MSEGSLFAMETTRAADPPTTPSIPSTRQLLPLGLLHRSTLSSPTVLAYHLLRSQLSNVLRSPTVHRSFRLLAPRSFGSFSSSMPAYNKAGLPRTEHTTPSPIDTSSISSAMDVDPVPVSSTTAHVEREWKGHSIPIVVGNFELLADEDLEYAKHIKVAKWRSKETGLKVVWCDVEGPLVQGYFSVATEIFDDSGRPHTLEHLIFMGSEKYPYKGVLDTLANRMFANGTNAWTDTTNTTYTVGTAGAEGFLGILPVFLDHVLYPTLTQAGFVTEVHNINGKGEDSGVVYSEMQGRENGSDDLMQLRLQRTLYSKKNAYRSETGGLMDALRTLKVEEIREYHGSSYLPHNLTLIVTGRSLPPLDLLNTLQTEVEPSLIAHHQNKGPRPPNWLRPFVESSTASNHPTIPENKTEIVEFPEKDESTGQIYISWIGPRSQDFLTGTAMQVLCEYMVDGAVSPLYEKFVEVEEPSCTDISFASSNEDPSIISAYLSSVPSPLLKTLDAEFQAELLAISQKEIDMTRMKSIIALQKLKTLEMIETNAAEGMSQTVLADALFGNDNGSELGPSMANMTEYKTLGEWSSAQWIELLNQYLVKPNCITIIGQPSAALASSIEKADKARIASTIARLGPEGLAKAGKEVSDAQEENDAPIPDEVISAFNVPDVTKIDWIKVESARSGGVAKEASGARSANRVQEHLDADGAELPLFVQFDHINSNFIEININLFAPSSAAALPAHLRALLPIYLDSFFSLPITRADGTELSFDEVVRALDAETLSYSIDIRSPLQEGLSLRIKVAKDKYPIAIAWARDLLFGSRFAIERLKISATKALQDIPGEKRDGSEVSYSAYKQLICSPDSTNIAMNLLNRAEFLPAFVARLKEEPEAVIKEFEAFRDGVTNPKAMRISVKGDILGLTEPTTSWRKNFKEFPRFKASELTPIVLSKDVMGPLGRKPSREIVVFGVSSIESSFAYHVAKGPEGWSHPDQPALTVARSVLNAMEGFLWKFIRGAGLAYGASIEQDLESGLVYLSVYKSPDSYAAFDAARDLISKLVSGEIEITGLTLESAKSSLAYNTAAKESTMNDAANASFTQQVLLGLPGGHGRIALAKTKDITVAEVVSVIRQWIQPIFDPTTSIGSVATGTAKLEEIAGSFEKIGYTVERRTFAPGGDDEDESGSEDGSESGSEGEEEK